MDSTERSNSASAESALGRLRSRVTGHAEAIRLACLWEATAPKVGNVHPEAAFDDCCFADFCAAAACIAPLLAGESSGFRSPSTLPTAVPVAESPAGLGDRVLAAITATQSVTRANVNLGIVLLIAPLALAHNRADVARVLANLTSADGAQVYRAIRLAGPGGMDSDPVEDAENVETAELANIDLIAAMRSARDRDRIARQYADNFADFFENIVPVVEAELAAEREIGEAIVRAQLKLLAAEPDSLIRRKCGDDVAGWASRAAAACFTSDGRWDASQREALDRWLREDGNRRNPGTTADLIAAAIYWLIR